MIVDNREAFQHYGVRGMKWGVRKDRRIGAAPVRKSLSTRIYEHKAKKYANNDSVKSQKMADKASRSAERDIQRQRYKEKMEVGELIVKSMLGQIANQNAARYALESGTPVTKAMANDFLLNPPVSKARRARNVRRIKKLLVELMV